MADLKAVAEKLVGLSRADALPEIIRFFKEEYGIDLVVVMTAGLEDEKCLCNTDLKALLREKQISMLSVSPAPEPPKTKPFVPRKVGKPRGFPPNMRRRK